MGRADTVSLTYTAEIADLKKKLAEIPGATGREAKKAVAEVSKAVKLVAKAEAEAKKAAEGSAAGLKSLGDAAGKTNSPELIVDLSIGGAQSLHVMYDMERGEDECRQAITRRYDEVIARCGPLSNVAPALAQGARAQFVKGRARDMARLRAAIKKENAKREQFGFAQADRERDAAWESETAAMDALLAFKPSTLAESDAKGRYLLGCVGGRYMQLYDDQVAILLRSLTSEGLS